MILYLTLDSGFACLASSPAAVYNCGKAQCHSRGAHIYLHLAGTCGYTALFKDESHQMPKVFIIGLPRTGTTSMSVALLELGLSVAHTAFTKKAFEMADAISDAPCFSDYQQLDALFPQAKFIYLTRDMDKWVPSMTMLLEKMAPHLAPKTGRFNPILKRSFHHIFGAKLPLTHSALINCYAQHQQAVLSYFKDRDNLLSIDISEQGSLLKMKQFLDIPTQGSTDFPKLNVGRNVASWKEYKHPNKINSNLAGIEHRKYFDYSLT